MFGIECYDMHDKPLDHYTQWDVNQVLKVKVLDADDTLLDNAPCVHFANVKSTEALVVKSTVSGSNTIVVDVPNKILEEPWPLLVYIYLQDSSDAESQKTIIRIEIPVVKRVRPSDYEYVENIDRITADSIKSEIMDGIYDQFAESIADGSVAFPYVTILDSSNSKKQKVGAKSDRLTFTVDSQERTVLDDRDKTELNQSISAASSKIDSTNSNVSSLTSRVASVESGKVAKSDIVNDLTTDDSTKPLSAAMGKQLKDTIDSGGSASQLISQHNSSDSAHTDIRDLVSKAQSKADDAYTAAMAGGGTAAAGIEAHNTSPTAHADIRELIEGLQTGGGSFTALTDSEVQQLWDGTLTSSAKGLSGTGLRTLSDEIRTDMATKSHNHDASNITSGTLPIARGGTGATTADAVRKNVLSALSEYSSTIGYNFLMSTTDNNGTIGVLPFDVVKSAIGSGGSSGGGGGGSVERTNLWTGTWSAGPLTVSGIQNYEAFVMYNQANVAMICFMAPSKTSINGYGLLCTEMNVLRLDAVSLTVSGNQMMRTLPKTWILTGTQISTANESMTITRIDGLF